ncbi:prepilin-type N-terminal cleavage/methylation domain-containing protein [Candidatus Avelusimicrobium facis]|uniref:type IV pilin protein n=1 Tax=Candidatus Avelusimicrobium facis TaxID=3416203 RepID=UPI003D140AA8
MTKKQLLKKAFTLTELLIVVIVLGVLAAVAVPKFSRVLETRKTAEAERILTALRAEQEHRCVLGKEYHSQTGRTDTLADAKNGKNYTYSLTRMGSRAVSAKGYSIQMPSYKSGVLCCSGNYCNKLNKSYPACDSVSVPQDECAPPCEDCSCPEYAAAHRCECAHVCTCTENPHQEKCCAIGTEVWNAGTQRCEPNTTCSNPEYAAAHRCECANDCSCTENPHQEKCCSIGTEVWNAGTQRCEPNTTCSNPEYAAAHPCECANECSCEENPNQAKCCATSPEGKTVQRQDCGTGYIGKKVRRWNTETCAWGDWDETECYLAEVDSCGDITYAAAHPCECDAGYAEANPCECKGECGCPESIICKGFAKPDPAAGCACTCSLTLKDCGPNEIVDEKSCLCIKDCKPKQCPSGQEWDESRCECVTKLVWCLGRGQTMSVAVRRQPGGGMTCADSPRVRLNASYQWDEFVWAVQTCSMGMMNVDLYKNKGWPSGCRPGSPCDACKNKPGVVYYDNIKAYVDGSPRPDPNYRSNHGELPPVIYEYEWKVAACGLMEADCSMEVIP